MLQTVTSLILIVLSSAASAANPTPCESLHMMLGHSEKSAQNLCQAYKKRGERSSDDKVGQCILDWQEVLSENKMDPSMASVCFHTSQELQEKVLKNINCLKSYDGILAPNYWLLEDRAVLDKTIEPANSLFSSMTQQCAVEAAFKLPSPVISRTVFHSKTPADKTGLALGGLSGLAYTSTHYLYAISDDRMNPSISTFTLTPGTLKVKFDSTYPLFGPFTDLEDLALDTDGSIFVTSEEIPNVTYVSDKKMKSPKSYIFKINKKGEFLEDVKIPEEYYSNTLELDAMCGDKDPGFWASLADAFSGESKKKMAALSAKDRARCQNYKQAKGIRYNRGIESLHYDVHTQKLYFMPEQPLQNKSGIEKNIRFAVMDLKNNTHELYEYPIDLTYENGVVAILKTKNQSLLVLERGFDSVAREAVVKLYKTKIPDDKNKVMEKTLILNFKKLLSQMPAGLNRVDNFEGMTWGPQLPDGRKTLVVVADNNYSLKQKNDFFVFAVEDAWLE